MGLRKYAFNALGSPFDLIEEDIVVTTSDPTSGQVGVLYFNTNNPTVYWYFDASGNRYYITGTLDNPANQRTYGILLAIPIT